MTFQRCVTSLFSDEIELARDRYAHLLGFRIDMDLGWFVSLRHDDHPELEIALTDAQHPSVPKDRRTPASGLAVAFVVDDVDALHEALSNAGVEIVQAPTDHPWGQRQVLAAWHDGVLLDVIQFIEPDPDWMAANGLAGADV